jgi:hypothetical protein
MGFLREISSAVPFTTCNEAEHGHKIAYVNSGPKVVMYDYQNLLSVVFGERLKFWYRNYGTPKTAKTFLVTKRSLGYIFLKIITS